MLKQKRTRIHKEAAVLTGLLLLLCVISGAVSADDSGGTENLVDSSTITATVDTYLGFGTEFTETFICESTGSNNKTVSGESDLVYVTTPSGFVLSAPSLSGTTLTFTIPQEALSPAGTRGAFVAVKSSGTGTEYGIRVAPDGDIGVLERVAVEEETVSVELTLPPKTNFIPQLVFENPAGEERSAFPQVSAPADLSEFENDVSSTTVSGSAGNIFYDYSSDFENAFYAYNKKSSSTVDTTTGLTYLTFSDASFGNKPDDDTKYRFTLTGVRGAAVKAATAPLTGTVSGIQVGRLLEEPLVPIPLDTVTSGDGTLVFDEDKTAVSYPRKVKLENTFNIYLEMNPPVPEPIYTLSIPAGISLTGSSSTDCEVSLAYECFTPDKQFNVVMKSSNAMNGKYQLKYIANSSVVIPYTIHDGEIEITPDLSGIAPIFSALDGAETMQTATKNLVITVPEKPLNAGSYTDTLTFVVTIEDKPSPTLSSPPPEA